MIFFPGIVPISSAKMDSINAPILAERDQFLNGPGCAAVILSQDCRAKPAARLNPHHLRSAFKTR
jgi:hypothetical protein